MKKIISFIGIFLSVSMLYGQRFGLAGPCQINVNNTDFHRAPRKEGIDATVKIVFIGLTGAVGGWCTGTLVNRAVGDNELGFYILTANHCIRDKSGLGDINVDFNAEHYVIFNYQSPNAINDSTPLSNRGQNYYQSRSIRETGNKGYEYFHKSKLRLVNSKKWGDFALLEILTPVPPHFNVSYAGWNPSKHGNAPGPIAGIHHPRGDIKKISGISGIQDVPNPVSTGCYIVTTVIDVLFGWIWGRTASTRTICKWVDIPYYTVPYFSFGTVEKGSSGSGLFDSQNNLGGILSGGISTCSFPVGEFYGAFYANYPNASIKNALNPYHNNAVDLWGLDSRRITMFDNLVLPGGDSTVNGYYFPAKHYQAENKIELKSRSTITTDRPITIFEGAEYEFGAKNSITLGPGFHVQSGAKFRAYILPPEPISVKESRSDLNPELIKHLERIILPPFSNIEIDSYIESSIKIFPNPAHDILNIHFVNGVENRKKIELVTITGQSILEKYISEKLETINIGSVLEGIYILKVIGKDNRIETEKISIAR